MNRFRYIIQITRSCFRTWRNAPRILVLLGMLASFTIIYVLPFSENAAAMGEKLHIVEAFIAMMNWRFSMLMFSAAVLLLFGDLPVVEHFTENALVKGSRKTWILGQTVYIIVTSFLLTVFIFFVSVFVCFPNIHVSENWSKPVKLLALNGRIAISQETMKLPFPKYIVQNYTPWVAFAYSFSLFFLMSCFYGTASLALRLHFKSGSFILLVLVNAVSWATGMFDAAMNAYAILSMLSIHYHASLFEHRFVKVNSLLPSIGISYAILAGLTAFFVLISLYIVRKYDYVQMEAEHV